MSGLLTRIRRRRPAAPPLAPTPPDSSPATQTTPEPRRAPAPEQAPNLAGEQASAVPSPPEPFERPGFRARGQLRRRLRYLRRVRELGLRDIGGLVFDLDRFGRSREDLVRGKLDALSAVDAELGTLAAALDDDASFDELREIGIVACPACGALLASESRFCSACGFRVDRGDAAIANAFAVGGSPGRTGAQRRRDVTAAANTGACPRCGGALASGQRWCLSCGLAAATTVAHARGWRRPLATAATLAAIALVALVLAFVLLTRNDNPVPPEAALPTQAAPAPPAADTTP